MDQLQRDFADITEMVEANRRANYHRARQEYESQRDAEVINELQRKLRESEASVKYWRWNFIILAVAVIGATLNYVISYVGLR